MSFHNFSNTAMNSACLEIRDLIENKSRQSDFEFFLEINDLAIQQMLRPLKESLLYSFSVNALTFSNDYWLKKIWDRSELQEFIGNFNAYNVPIPPYSEPSYEDFGIDRYAPDPESLCELSDAQNDYFNKYVDMLRDGAHIALAQNIAKEAIEYLFIDRELMKTFNEKVAQYLNGLNKQVYPSLFNDRGYVHRFSGKWPRWLEDALMYRENGRCAIGREDLTRLIGNNIKPNIDHIVPLALGGTNDTTNLQLVCRECNLKKLDHTVVTSNMRKTFFY